MNYFTNYHEWRTTMIDQARLTLDRDYCNARIAVLEDENAAETKTFIKLYGAPYNEQVIVWFHQAVLEQ